MQINYYMDLKNIESGSKPPGLDVLVRICNALGIPVEYIITNTFGDSPLTLPQFAIIDGLDETQQISCIEMLETFKKKKLGGKL